MILEHKTYDLFGKMTFEKIILTPPFKKLNFMPNEACFHYVIEGEGNSISEVEKMELPAKDSILMKCGTYITKMLPSMHAQSYQAVAVHFHPDVLKKIYENELPKFLQENSNVIPESNMVKIKSNSLFMKYVDGILFYFENPVLVNEELLSLKLKELILLLNQTKDGLIVKQILSSLFSPTTYSFKQVVDAHIFSNLTLDELAGLTNLSLSTFKREFNKIYNESPAKYMKDKKLEHAHQLLSISDKRISDIAFECGFNDQAHFSKSFHDKYEISPSNFRLTQKDKSLN